MPARKQTEIRGDDGYMLSTHARKQATMKGWSHEDVLAAANNPSTTYENRRYPGQMRHIRGSIVAVVHPETKKIVTAYENVTETNLRPDQTDKDAKAYQRRRNSR
jgi:hypothetical protein